VLDLRARRVCYFLRRADWGALVGLFGVDEAPRLTLVSIHRNSFLGWVEVGGLVLNVDEILLLGSKNRPWSADSIPGDKFLRRPCEMLHTIQPNQSPGSPKPRLAVDRQRTGLPLRDLKELLRDLTRRTTSIHEEQIIVPDPRPLKQVLVIGLVVQAYNSRHIHLLEYRYILSRRPHTEAVYVIWSVRGIAECDKFSRQNPVKITIFDLFMVFVKLAVEGCHVKPIKHYCSFQCRQAVEDCMFIVARYLTRITEIEKWLSRRQMRPCVNRRALHHQNLEGAH
jgi:hypothetical protein